MDATPPLERQLVAALLAEDSREARRVAVELHARGFDAAAIDAALAEYPQLEAALWATLSEVIPLSRRAAKRRAIRAAEQRDWGEWPEGRREP